jgi:AcrR family transcriptional regulator
MTRKPRTAAAQDGEDLDLWSDIRPEASQRLLLAALQSFADRGFHGTTTRDIAKRARMSPAALYSHYPSKAELLHQISRATHEGMLRLMQDSFAREAKPVERLTNLVRTHARYHALHHTAARVANYELHSLLPRHRAEVQKLRVSMENVMHEAIRLGVESGDFVVQDINLASIALLSLGIDIARWYRPGGRLTPDQLADSYAEYAHSVLRGGARFAPVAAGLRRRGVAGTRRGG